MTESSYHTTGNIRANMKFYGILFVFSMLVVVNSEYVTRKFCKDVDQTKCHIHNVRVDPCAEGPGFCAMKRKKPYILNVDFTPYFPAQNLRVAVYSHGDDDVDKLVSGPDDACEYTPCPVEAGQRRELEMHLVLDKTVPIGKSPVKIKVWDIEDDSQSCCFMIMAKLHK